MDPVRIGLIGCGVIGRHHARAASQCAAVKLVAVADLIEERGREIAAQYNVPARYCEGLDLLDDPQVEAVILALPACGRLVLALKAFRNGKHVLTEKPVAMNAADVVTMIKARGNLVATCGHARPRFTAAMQQVTGFITGGALGDLRVLNCRAITSPSGPPQSPPPTWRLRSAENGGGILVNWGCYDLDYLLGLTGWRVTPRTVLARTWTVPPTYGSYIAPHSDAETHVTALILCDGGAVINYERSEDATARSESMWQITGDKASLHLNMIAGKEYTVTLDRATADGGTVTENLLTSVEGPFDGMGLQLDDFAHAIRAGRRPHTELEQALVVQRITDAIYASARSGKAVEVVHDR